MLSERLHSMFKEATWHCYMRKRSSQNPTALPLIAVNQYQLNNKSSSMQRTCHNDKGSIKTNKKCTLG